MKNRGFTMVELLVSLGISSLVMGLILSFFVTSYKGYKTLRNDSELRFQAQYILNYITDKAINSQTLSLVNVNNTTSYSMTTIRNKDIDYPANKISFKYGSNEEENYVFYIENNNIRYGNGEKDIKPSVELGNYVDGMFISLFEDGSFGNARALIIKLIMKKDGQIYEAFQAAYMRNN